MHKDVSMCIELSVIKCPYEDLCAVLILRFVLSLVYDYFILALCVHVAQFVKADHKDLGQWFSSCGRSTTGDLQF